MKIDQDSLKHFAIFTSSKSLPSCMYCILMQQFLILLKSKASAKLEINRFYVVYNVYAIHAFACHHLLKWYKTPTKLYENGHEEALKTKTEKHNLQAIMDMYAEMKHRNHIQRLRYFVNKLPLRHLLREHKIPKCQRYLVLYLSKC